MTDDHMTEMHIVGVTEQDTRARMRWRQMIHCGDT